MNITSLSHCWKAGSIEIGHAVVLPSLGRSADFALASDPEGVLEGVISLALVHSATRSAVGKGTVYRTLNRRHSP